MRNEDEGLAGLSPFFRARRRWAFLACCSSAPHPLILTARFSCSSLIRSSKLRVPHVRSSELRVWRPLDAYFGRTNEGDTSNGRANGAGRCCRQYRAPILTCRHRFESSCAHLYVLGGHLARKGGRSKFGRVETGAGRDGRRTDKVGSGWFLLSAFGYLTVTCPFMSIGSSQSRRAKSPLALFWLLFSQVIDANRESASEFST